MIYSENNPVAHYCHPTASASNSTPMATKLSSGEVDIGVQSSADLGNVIKKRMMLGQE